VVISGIANTNVTNIATNVTNIATNVTDIATNAADIIVVSGIANTAYGWGDHSLQSYSTSDTTYTAGSGLELHGTAFQAAISGANLLATNTPSDNQLASYDAATGKFTWVAAGGGGVDAANGASDRIATFTDSDSLNGEANLTFDGTDLTIATGSIEVRTIDYSDGDNAITIADGGAVTFAQSINQAHEAGSEAGGVLSFDCSKSNYFEVTVSAQVNSIVFTNATAGQRIVLLITNSTGSAHLSDANGWDTITINTNSGGDVLWAAGIEPTLTASGKDMYGIIFSSNVLVAHAFIIGQDIKA
jgi:hypothetical protein